MRCFADSVLGMPMRGHRVQHLALQVRLVDDVGVHDRDRADARRGQVQAGRRAEAAGADQQHLRVEQLQLAGLADLGDQRVARVAGALRLARARAARSRGSRLLPAAEAAGERGDVLVAELLERARGEGRARARLAADRRWAVARSGTSAPMRDSRLPRGMCTEPSIAPWSNSSGSRTSMSTGGSSEARRAAASAALISWICVFTSARRSW